MPNTAIHAAAEGVPHVNRRAFLHNAGSTAVALPLAAATTVIPADVLAEEPMARIMRLVEELSVAMNDWTFGADHWSVVVYPKVTGGKPFFEQTGAKPTPTILRMIAAHRDAHEEFEASCNPADITWCKSRNVDYTPAAERRWRRAERAEGRALMDLCRYKAESQADRTARAKYLLAHTRLIGDELQPEYTEALLRSEAKAMTAWSPPATYENWLKPSSQSFVDLANA